MSSKLKYALPLLALSLTVQPVQAQLLGLLWDTNVTLTRADLDMIKGLLGQQIHDKRPGSSASWKNPESGNSGAVTLLKSFVRQGLRCEEIEYRMSPPERAKPSDRFVLTSCRQADGTWKLS